MYLDDFNIEQSETSGASRQTEQDQGSAKQGAKTKKKKEGSVTTNLNKLGSANCVI